VGSVLEGKGADMKIGIVGAGHIGGTLTRRPTARVPRELGYRR
jgi:prephenate dehydrogenase